MSSVDRDFLDFKSTKKKKYYFAISILYGIFKIFIVKWKHYNRMGRYSDKTPLYVGTCCSRSDRNQNKK